MHMFKCGSALTQVPDKEKTMNESLESPVRRLPLPRSLRLSLVRLRVISRGLLAIRFLQSRVAGGLLLHRAVQVDISNLFTRRPQPKGSCKLGSYTLSGSLTISRP